MRKNETVVKVDAKKFDTSKHAPPVLDGAWGQGTGAGAASSIVLVCAASKQPLTRETLLPRCRLLIPHWSSMCLIPVFSRKELFFFQRETIG